MLDRRGGSFGMFQGRLNEKPCGGPNDREIVLAILLGYESRTKLMIGSELLFITAIGSTARSQFYQNTYIYDAAPICPMK